ncbi:MAG: GlcG/HbpS family heme-binding protein [Hyphomicrobiales bacterium]
MAAAPLRYGPSITLEEAKGVMSAAEAEASRNGWPMVIAIVDTAGRLVMFERMDHAQNGSILIAPEKARTAVDFKRPTKALQDAVAQGGVNLRLLGAPNILAMEGGLPIMRNGEIIGGIGVSGMSSNQDAQVAEAGLAALLE